MRIIATLLLLSLSSFAQDSTGKVVVYRFHDRYLGVRPQVFCDGAKAAKLDKSNYFVFAVTGKHTFRSQNKEAGVELDVRPGETYYLRIHSQHDGEGRVDIVPDGQGKFETNGRKEMTASCSGETK